MGFLSDKIGRLSHRFFYRAKMFFVHARAGVTVVFVTGCLFSPLMFMQRGSFAYCTESLVHCMEEETTGGNVFSKGAGILTCGVKTLWCDLETIWFFLTDDAMDDKSLVGEPLPDEGSAVERDFVPAERAAFSSGDFKDEEMSGPELKKEMERLRAEREVFEKNQTEMRKKIFETLESQTKPDNLSGKEAREDL